MLKRGGHIKLWKPIVIIVLLDQLLKLYIKTTFEVGESFSVFPWFIIYFVENNGFAFGLEFFGTYGKLFLTFTRIFFVVFICLWLKKILNDTNPQPRPLIWAFILIISGAIGNIIDSVFYGLIFGYAPIFFGKVVDMFYLPLASGYYPDWVPFFGGDYFEFFRYIFNIADSCITVGAILLLFNYKHLTVK